MKRIVIITFIAFVLSFALILGCVSSAPTTSEPVTEKSTSEPIIVTGSSDKTSPPFTITTEEWDIDWSYVPDPEYPDSAVFKCYVYPMGTTTLSVASIESALYLGSSGSVYSYAGAGEYYIKVTVANVKSWEIVISPQ